MRRAAIIGVMLVSLSFVSACRCIPCLSGPFQDVVAKGDVSAPGSAAISTFPLASAAGRQNLSAVAVHGTRTAAVSQDPDRLLD